MITYCFGDLMSTITPFRTLLSVSLLIALTGCGEEKIEDKPEMVRSVRLIELNTGGEQSIRRFPANVIATQEVELSFRVSGEVNHFDIKPAMTVKKGEVLAKVDDRDFKTEVALKKADYELAKREFERARKMRDKQLLAQADFDSAEARLNSAKGSLSLAQDRLNDSTLVAPFSGRIAKTLVENHQQIQAQQSILVLQNDNSIDVSIQLPENLLSRIERGSIDMTYQPYVTFYGSEQKYPVSYKQHTTKATSGTQAYEVIFTLPVPNADRRVYPGMGATLHLDLNRILPNKAEQKNYVVPVNAVLDNDNSGEAEVWVYRDNRVFPMIVTKHEITHRGVNISGDFIGDEQLVSAGLSQLSSDMKVIPMIRERGL